MKSENEVWEDRPEKGGIERERERAERECEVGRMRTEGEVYIKVDGYRLTAHRCF